MDGGTLTLSFLFPNKKFPVDEMNDCDFHEFPLRCAFLLQAQSSGVKRPFPLNELIVSTVCYSEEKLADMQAVSRARHGTCSYGICTQARVGDKG